MIPAQEASQPLTQRCSVRESPSGGRIRSCAGALARAGAFALAVTLGAGAAGCGNGSDPPLEHSSPERAAAADLLQRYQTQFPYPTALWSGIGSGTPARKQWAQRERELLSQLGQDEDGVAHTELGELYTRVEEHGRGMAFLVRALERDAGNGRAWLWLGVNRLSVGRLDEAERLIDWADQLLPQNAAAARFRGDLHFRQGALARAEEAFAKSVALDPNQFDAQLSLGALLEEREAWEGARAHLERALELRPDNLEALFRLARIARNQGREVEAQSYASKHARATILDDWGYLVSGVPDDECSAALGIYYLERGRIRAAQEEFERALETASAGSAPRFNALLGRVRCAMALGQVDETQFALEQLVAEAPDHQVLEELRLQLTELEKGSEQQ